MNNEPETCSQCQGTLTTGFILVETIGGHKPAEWIEGSPETSLWSGVKTTGKKRYFVKAYRCELCGRLEFYT